MPSEPKQTRHRVRALTPAGIARARQFLADARTGSATEAPAELLADAQLTTEVNPACYVEPRAFKTRRDAGAYLADALQPLGVGNTHRNYPLWSWLGMFYFEQLVSCDADGKFRMGNLPDYAFVIDGAKTDDRDVPANRLMLAWETYVSHGDSHAGWMLSQSVMAIGKIVGRLIRSQHRYASREFVKLLGIMYFEPATGRLKRGAGADSRGGVSRLRDVLDQLYMTYDVYGMEAEQLLALLPDEFRRFNPDAGSARRRANP